MSTSTIEAHAPVATLINRFTVAPSRQRELVDVLVQATEDVIRHRPGFVAANIHASLDGKYVLNYAQWENEDAFHAMLADPACQEHMAKASAIGEAEPALYTVESVQHR
jgi:quinol monooxygenase YgiN